jgi:hypothetical protein
MLAASDTGPLGQGRLVQGGALAISLRSQRMRMTDENDYKVLSDSHERQQYETSQATYTTEDSAMVDGHFFVKTFREFIYFLMGRIDA